MAHLVKDSLKDWVVSTKESHPNKIVNSIFKESDKGEIIARILIHRSKESILKPEYTGFICGRTSYGDRMTVWEVTDASKEVVALLIDLKLIEMGYKVKNVGKFNLNGE